MSIMNFFKGKQEDESIVEAEKHDQLPLVEIHTEPTVEPEPEPEPEDAPAAPVAPPPNISTYIRNHGRKSQQIQAAMAPLVADQLAPNQ